MKLRTVILSALATVTVSSAAFAADGEAGAGGAGPTLYFDDVTATAFPPAPCGDPDHPFKLGCYTSFLVISDIDGDGDLDIAFANGGGYYEPDDYDNDAMSYVSGKESSVVYLNDGHGAFRDATATAFGAAASRLRQVAIADVDGDGDMDLYQPGGFGIDNDKLFIQTAPGVFSDQALTHLPVGMRSHAGSAHFGDLDNDGDLDLVIGDWGGADPLHTDGNTWVYLNDGKGVFTSQPADVVPPPMDWSVGAGPIDIDLADVDGDYDLDILVDNRNGQSRLFLNDGTGKFSDASEGYPKKNGPYTYNVEACDFDEDGDLDLLLDNAGSHVKGQGNTSQVLVNDGKGKFTDETEATISGEPRGDDNAVKCADINGDGHYDLVVASLTAYEKLLINDGTAHFSYVEGAFNGPKGLAFDDSTLGIDIGDLDGDGKLDVITGQGEGTPREDRIYYGAGAAAKDTTPPKFRGVEVPAAAPNKPIVMHFAVTDAYTSETGEEVKSVYASYTVDGGKAIKVPAKFVGGDLFRVVLPAQPPGTTLAITPTAVDRVNLTGTAPVVTLSIGGLGEGGAGGEGGTPEEAAGATSGGAGGKVGSGGKGGSGGSVVTPEGGEAGTSAGSGGAVTTSDDGCGCSIAGQPASRLPWLAGLGLAFAALRRRRGHKNEQS